MLGEPTRLYHPDDVGTRIEHLMQMQDLWSSAYAFLTRPNVYHTDLEKARALTLEIGLDLLQNHMEIEYNHVPYAKEINSLPKDAEIDKRMRKENIKRNQ